jgi:hypothetical protein
MKTTKWLLTCLLLIATAALFGQDCVDYHRSAGCNMDRQRGYKIYSQSKSAVITVKDTIEFNIVFYGQKDYIFSFCTRQDLYPIHFRLIDPASRDVLYDNANDRYIESLGIGFDTTRSLAVQITVLADKARQAELEDDVGCIGLLMQYRSYPNVR